MRCYFTCADDSNHVVFLGMPHDDPPLLYRKSRREEPLLIDGMVGVRNSGGQRITKDGLRFCKRHLMVHQIVSGLYGIPVEFHE